MKKSCLLIKILQETREKFNIFFADNKQIHLSEQLSAAMFFRNVPRRYPTHPIRFYSHFHFRLLINIGFSTEMNEESIKNSLLFYVENFGQNQEHSYDTIYTQVLSILINFSQFFSLQLKCYKISWKWCSTSPFSPIGIQLEGESQIEMIIQSLSQILEEGF